MIASLPVPLGPTISTTRPGPSRSAPDVVVLEHPLPDTGDLANDGKTSRQVNAHQVGTQARRDLAAIGKAGRTRGMQSYGPHGGREAEALDAARKLERAHQQAGRHIVGREDVKHAGASQELGR